jgi:hypothetical protein
MHILFGSLFIGLFSSILFKVLFLFILNKYILLFTLGFLKHFLTYYLNFHTYYCNNGSSCKKVLDKNKTYVATKSHLFEESIIEGFLFLVASIFIFYGVHLLNIFKFIKNEKTFPTLIVFIVGAITHILSEKLQLHAYYCKNRCVVKNIE